MKKLGFILISIVFLTLGTSCKTKQISVTKEQENHTVDVNEMVEKQETAQISNITENERTEVKELAELLQNLNVSYSGKDVNDKLDLLLSKTEQGTKLTISGKGTANYSEDSRKEFENLRVELYTRQDSLHNIELSYLQDLNAKIDSYIKTRDRQVETKGFQFGFWAVIGIATFSWIVLNLFLKWFKR